MLTKSWTYYTEEKTTSCVKYINQNLHYLISIPSKTYIAAYFQYGHTMINSKPK